MLKTENKTKFDAVHKGPFKIIGVHHPNITILEENSGKTLTVHKNRLTI